MARQVLLSNCEFTKSTNKELVRISRGTIISTKYSKYLLSQVSDDEIIAINLKSGNRHSNTVHVQDVLCISEEELKEIFNVNDIKNKRYCTLNGLSVDL